MFDLIFYLLTIAAVAKKQITPSVVKKFLSDVESSKTASAVVKSVRKGVYCENTNTT